MKNEQPRKAHHTIGPITRQVLSRHRRVLHLSLRPRQRYQQERIAIISQIQGPRGRFSHISLVCQFFFSRTKHAQHRTQWRATRVRRERLLVRSRLSNLVAHACPRLRDVLAPASCGRPSLYHRYGGHEDDAVDTLLFCATHEEFTSYYARLAGVSPRLSLLLSLPVCGPCIGDTAFTSACIATGIFASFLIFRTGFMCSLRLRERHRFSTRPFVIPFNCDCYLQHWAHQISIRMARFHADRTEICRTLLCRVHRYLLWFAIMVCLMGHTAMQTYVVEGFLAVEATIRMARCRWFEEDMGSEVVLLFVAHVHECLVYGVNADCAPGTCHNDNGCSCWLRADC